MYSFCAIYQYRSVLFLYFVYSFLKIISTDLYCIFASCIPSVQLSSTDMYCFSTSYIASTVVQYHPPDSSLLYFTSCTASVQFTNIVLYCILFYVKPQFNIKILIIFIFWFSIGSCINTVLCLKYLASKKCMSFLSIKILSQNIIILSMGHIKIYLFNGCK